MEQLGRFGNKKAAKKLSSSAPSLDLGGANVKVEPDARRFLAKLPRTAIHQILQVVREWAKTAPVKATKLSLVSEPEDDTWKEAVLRIFVEATTPEALLLWDQLGAAIDRANADLPKTDRDLLAQQFGIHLDWWSKPKE